MREAGRRPTRLVGRDAELRAILNGLQAGSDRSVVIAGPAGAGKTRLAAEVAGQLRGSGLCSMHVAAMESLVDVPFGAFAVAMPQVDLSGALVDVLRDAPRAMTALAGGRLLLIVDDAQRLDISSATLLGHMAATRACLVLATLRTPGPVPDPVTALWKGDHAHRIDLAPLDAAKVEELAADVLGGPIAGRTTRWLANASEGNPLYARELIFNALEHGALDEDVGRWLVRGPVPISDRLSDLISAQLHGLSARATHLVDLLAVGQPVPFDVLVELAGDDGMEEAEESGLLTGDETGITLSHPLLAEVRRHEMPRVRLRRLSAQLAASMPLPSTASGPQLIRHARWALESGTHADAELLTRAAAAARTIGDLDLATALARGALRAGAGAGASLVLGEALFFAGRSDAAAEVLAAAAPTCANDDELASISFARAYVVGTLLGDRCAAERILSDAASRLSEPAARMKVIGSLTMFRVLAGEPLLALPDADAMVTSSDVEIADRGLHLSAMAHAQHGDGETAIELGARCEARRAPMSGDGMRAGVHRVGPMLALIGMGRVEEAATIAQQARDESGNDLQREATNCVIGGMAAFEQGDLTAALRLFSDGVALNHKLDDSGPLRWCLGGVALAAATTGAGAEVAEATTELDTIGPHWMGMFEYLIERGRAWAEVLQGDLPGAVDRLITAAEIANGRGQHIGEASLLHDLVRLDRPDAAIDQLNALSEHVDGALIAAFALHAQAQADSDPQKLESAATELERLGMDLYAAEAGSAGARLEQRAGNVRRATAWRRHVDQLVRRCGPVRTPALAGRGLVARLTKREREVALLASAIPTNAAIAERLHISERTVENHLQRAYEKLGVRGRRELSAALAEQERPSGGRDDPKRLRAADSEQHRKPLLPRETLW
jgi:DNA-binding CsgD family transcriptional regulator